VLFGGEVAEVEAAVEYGVARIAGSGQEVAHVVIPRLHEGMSENLVADLEGRPLKSIEFAPRGMLVSLGMNDAVVNFMGLKFSGYFAWLFWNAVHLLKLVGLKKQLQVALDWSLATLFPRDISIIRRPARCRLCHGPHSPDAH